MSGKAFPVLCDCGHTDFFETNENQKHCRLCTIAVSTVKGVWSYATKGASVFFKIPSGAEVGSVFDYQLRVSGQSFCSVGYKYDIRCEVKQIDYLSDEELARYHEAFIFYENKGKRTVVVLAVEVILKKPIDDIDIFDTKNISIDCFDMVRIYDGHIKF